MLYYQDKKQTDEEIAAEEKRERRNYNLLVVVNLGLLLMTVILLGMFGMSVFQGNWPHAAGFAFCIYCVWWVFRRVPWPETKQQRAMRELREAMQRFNYLL